ncbi:General secretion pathway protein K [uncultured Candidatus Thioglobus sp.]|nr:General secretion pathway protein K [uncultured Candidatus Thioglobus sp.]
MDKDPCIRVEYRLKGDFHPFANFYKTCINLAKTGFIKITNWIKIVIYPTSNPNAGILDSKNQRGVALVSVLIIVALISLAVSLMWQQQASNLNNTKHIINSNQAISYLYSIEAWTQSILKNNDAKVDDTEEDWAKEIPPILIPNGIIAGKISDFQARVNINQIITINQDAGQAFLNPNYNGCLNTLNTLLEQDFMSDFILDYINTRQPLQKFAHLSQFKQVEGIEFKDYLKIKPYLYASEQNNPININTASAKVISCLHPDLSPSAAESIITSRPFKSLADAQRAIQQALNGLTFGQVTKKFNNKLISINSHYFLLESDININNTHLKAQTLFHRKSNLISVVERSYQQIIE